MASKAPKPAGRPLAFDRDQALDRAMCVFWQKGYAGASLTDLTAAMGIRPPSLYAAFGNKQALFEESLERYLAGPVAYMRDALEEATAYQVAARLLLQTAEFLTKDGLRRGCMTIQGALAGGEETGPIRRKLIKLRLRAQKALCLRFERAKSEGNLPKTVNTADLARFVTTIFQGMTVQAVNGATQEELLRLGEIALQVCPKQEPSRVSDAQLEVDVC